LLELGWVEHSAEPSPKPDGPHAERLLSLQAARVSPADRRRLADEQRAASRKRLRSVIDWRTFEGLWQVYSAMNLDGSASTGLLAMLAPDGTDLELLLAPIPGRPDLYPLTVAVSVDDRRVGDVVLAADAESSVRLPLPERPDDGRALEVLLRPERRVMIRMGRQWVPASFVPRLVASRRSR
jgi:hypothetical protein